MLTFMPSRLKPAQACEALREKFEEAADSVLDRFEAKRKISYDRADLRERGVSLEHVDISEDSREHIDPKFPDSNPLSLDELEK